MTEKNDPRAPQSAPQAPAKSAPAAPDPLVKMKHESDTHDYTLTIGEHTYSVKAGEVSVPLSDVAGAELSGFRRV
jgi:hypothetical protein